MNLAHRYPLLLVDKVLECVEGERVSAVKNISYNEKVFLGHFPGQPIYPAIYIVEGLCQCAQIMLGATVAVTAKLDEFKFLAQVKPGDQLVYDIKLQEMVGNFQIAVAKATVNGKAVAKGKIVGCSIEPT